MDNLIDPFECILYFSESFTIEYPELRYSLLLGDDEVEVIIRIRRYLLHIPICTEIKYISIRETLIIIISIVSESIILEHTYSFL